jgi:hypothetical protein
MPDFKILFNRSQAKIQTQLCHQFFLFLIHDNFSIEDSSNETTSYYLPRLSRRTGQPV